MRETPQEMQNKPTIEGFPEAKFQDVARRKLALKIEPILQQHGNGIQAGLWVSRASDEAWFSQNAGAVLPTASSIKSFLLVELFSKHRNQLDAPLPGSDALLDDETHPAFAHFTPQGREEIRQELRGASVRTVGEVLMGKTEVSNLVYNAASNLAIAALGEPHALTKAIHERDPDFASVRLNRYMLTDRKQQGDNEMATFSLARLYQQLASKQLAGIDADTMRALHEVLFLRKDETLGKLYFKDGLLESKPVTIVLAGWWHTPQGPVVFVVMTAETAPQAPEGEAAAAVLGQTANALADALVFAGYEALKRA